MKRSVVVVAVVLILVASLSSYVYFSDDSASDIFDPFEDPYPSFEVTSYVRCHSPHIFSRSDGSYDAYWVEDDSQGGPAGNTNDSFDGVIYSQLDPLGSTITDPVSLDGTFYSGWRETFDLLVFTVANDTRFTAQRSSSYLPQYYVANGSDVLDHGYLKDVSWPDDGERAARIENTTVPADGGVVIDTLSNVTIFSIMKNGFNPDTLAFERYTEEGEKVAGDELDPDMSYYSSLPAVAGEDSTIYFVFQNRSASISGGTMNHTTFSTTNIVDPVPENDVSSSSGRYLSLKYFDQSLHLMYLGGSGVLHYSHYDLQWNLISRFNTTIRSGDFDFLVDQNKINILHANESRCLRFTSIDRTDGTVISNTVVANRTFTYLVQADKPVIYLYPEDATTDTISVTLPGNATVTIPDIPLGRTITWEDVEAYPDGTLKFEGQEYPYLFYEGEFCPLTSNEGWKVARTQGELYLNDRSISYEDLKHFFRDELTRAGLFENEVDDFMEYWFGADELFFFEKEDFCFSVMYIQEDGIDQVCPLTTEYHYESIVRYFLSVEPWTVGTVLRDPDYPEVDQHAASAIHEWGVIEGFPWEPEVDG